MENHISPAPASASLDAKGLLEENNRLLKEIKAGNDRLERYLKWNRVWSVLRLLIILAPILLGLIFLRPYMQEAFSSYQELFGLSGAGGTNQSFDILDELKKYQQVEN